MVVVALGVRFIRVVEEYNEASVELRHRFAQQMLRYQDMPMIVTSNFG